MSAWRHADHALEHAGEGGWAAVAEIECNRGDRLATREPVNSLQDGHPSLPLCKAQASLDSEQTREASTAHSQRSGPVVDRLVNPRPLQKASASCRQFLAGREWHGEWVAARNSQFVQDEVHDRVSPTSCFVLHRNIDGLHEKLLEQFGNPQNAAMARQSTIDVGLEINATRAYGADHAKAVHYPTWDP